MSLRLLVCVLLLVACGGCSDCSGFEEVGDAGSPLDATPDGGEAGDATPVDGGAVDGGGGDPEGGADSGGKLAAGRCCGKKDDCASGLCMYLGQGPSYCSKTCTASADDCPVGFFCGKGGTCVPPNDKYSCGPDVAGAKAQGFGGCCGKKEDCTSGHCMSLGGGSYYCSMTCTRSPDSCPVKYLCSLSLKCVPSGTSSCSYE
jgi:hypothetical protein